MAPPPAATATPMIKPPSNDLFIDYPPHDARAMIAARRIPKFRCGRFTDGVGREASSAIRPKRKRLANGPRVYRGRVHDHGLRRGRGRVLDRPLDRACGDRNPARIQPTVRSTPADYTHYTLCNACANSWHGRAVHVNRRAVAGPPPARSTWVAHRPGAAARRCQAELGRRGRVPLVPIG